MIPVIELPGYQWKQVTFSQQTRFRLRIFVGNTLINNVGSVVEPRKAGHAIDFIVGYWVAMRITKLFLNTLYVL